MAVPSMIGKTSDDINEGMKAEYLGKAGIDEFYLEALRRRWEPLRKRAESNGGIDLIGMKYHV